MARKVGTEENRLYAIKAVKKTDVVNKNMIEQGKGRLTQLWFCHMQPPYDTLTTRLRHAYNMKKVVGS